jgi:hypothetical protein
VLICVILPIFAVRVKNYSGVLPHWQGGENNKSRWFLCSLLGFLGDEVVRNANDYPANFVLMPEFSLYKVCFCVIWAILRIAARSIRLVIRRTKKTGRKKEITHNLKEHLTFAGVYRLEPC